MKILETINLYDIYYCNSHAQNKKRPAVIVRIRKKQDEVLQYMALPVGELEDGTTQEDPIIIGRETGLRRKSRLMPDRIYVVDDPAQIGKKIGRICQPARQREIDRAVKKVLMAKKSDTKIQKQGKNICLCERCCRKYIRSKKYIVRRVNQQRMNRSMCCSCKICIGNDYFIYERR